MENRGGGPRRSTRNVARKQLTLEPSKYDDTGDADEPLNRLRPKTPAEIGSPSSSSSNSETKSPGNSGGTSEDDESGERPEGISRRGAGCGRGCGRGRVRGRGRGRGRGRQAVVVETNLENEEVIMSDSDETEGSDSCCGG